MDNINSLHGFDPQGVRPPGSVVTPAIKRVLGAAFPTTEFKVSTSYGQIEISWANGPAQEAIETALIEAGAEVRPNAKVRWICAYRRVLRFLNYGPIERAAEAEKRARLAATPDQQHSLNELKKRRRRPMRDSASMIFRKCEKRPQPRRV